MPLATTVCDCATSKTLNATCVSRRHAHCRTRTLPLKQLLPSGRRAMRLCLSLAFFTTFMQQPAYAVGTAAGTSIDNTATADYVIAGSNGSASDSVTFRVDEKLDVNVSWQDAANIAVSTPDIDRVTTWLLTNTGNGNDSYSLTVNNALGGEQFDPVWTDIYLDANNNGTFEILLDTLYSPGTNDPVLSPDATQTIFVRNSIPAGLTDGDLGDTELVATSLTASGVPGMSVANAGDGSTNAVVGSSGARSADTGTHQVASTTVALAKSVVITDPYGGSLPVTGATLTYRIDATVVGPGTATGVVVTDVLPTDTSYSGGTLTLNSATLTDITDGDAGDVDDSAVNTVTVNLGDLSAVSPAQTVTFEVTIN